MAAGGSLGRICGSGRVLTCLLCRIPSFSTPTVITVILLHSFPVFRRVSTAYAASPSFTFHLVCLVLHVVDKHLIAGITSHVRHHEQLFSSFLRLAMIFHATLGSLPHLAHSSKVPYGRRRLCRFSSLPSQLSSGHWEPSRNIRRLVFASVILVHTHPCTCTGSPASRNARTRGAACQTLCHCPV